MKWVILTILFFYDENTISSLDVSQLMYLHSQNQLQLKASYSTKQACEGDLPKILQMSDGAKMLAVNQLFSEGSSLVITNFPKSKKTFLQTTSCVSINLNELK